MPTPLRFGSFSTAGCAPFAGLVIDDRFALAVTALQPACLALGRPLSGTSTLAGLVEDWERNVAAIRIALEGGADTSMAVPLPQLRRHAPLPAPRQVVCCGANYRKHVVELLVAQGGGAITDAITPDERRALALQLMDKRAASGTPYAFVKATSAVAGPDDVLLLPAHVHQADWELELAVVMARQAFHVGRACAMEYVAGYMIANDITARDHVYRTDDMRVLGTDWLTGKSGPGFLPTGPYLVPREDVSDEMALRIQLSLNGELMQDESTEDMIFDIPRLLEYVTSRIRLFPGDVVCTGSPAGNGAHHNRYLQDGDVMEGAITGLGAQRVRCVRALAI